PRPVAGDGHVDSVIAEDPGEQIDVGKRRNVVQRQRLAGEKARNHQGQRSVLGTADRDGALQALAADNADTVHGHVTPSPPSPLRSLSEDRSPPSPRSGRRPGWALSQRPNLLPRP